MSTVGTATGFATGAMTALALGAGDAVATAIQNRRIEAAFRRWDEALKGERAARRNAEQRVLALRAENAELRATLARAQLESKILRAA